MRLLIIGAVIGFVIGAVFGTQAIAPRLPNVQRPEPVVTATTPSSRASAVPTLLGPAHAWKLASAHRRDEPLFGDFLNNLIGDLEAATDGELEMQFNDPDALVPVFGMFEAVAAGTVDVAFASPAYWSEQHPGLALFGGIPFGPAPEEFLAWLEHGGGRALHARLYENKGVVGVPCGLVGPRVSGWFKKEIASRADLIGLRMTAFGLGARVLEQMNVTLRPISDADVVAAFKLNVIDAAQVATPRIDTALGLHFSAGHVYLPGWQHQAGLVDLLINKNRWEALPERHQNSLRRICTENLHLGMSRSGTQYEALKKIQLQGMVRRWSPELLFNFHDSWTLMTQELIKKSPDFRETWTSLVQFRRTYSIWRELGYL